MKANLKAYDSAGRSNEALSQKTKDLSTVMDGQNAKVKELTKRRDEAVENTVKNQKRSLSSIRRSIMQRRNTMPMANS